jgi:hypothetical protein
VYVWAMCVSRSVPSNRISKDWFRYSKEAQEVRGVVFFLYGSLISVDMTVVEMEATWAFVW